MMLVTLVKIVVASQHKRQRKSLFQDLSRYENTDSDLKARARAALCKWATRTRQTCLSKTFANSPNKQKLSKQVLVMIKHCLRNSQINSMPAWSKEFTRTTRASRYYSFTARNYKKFRPWKLTFPLTRSKRVHRRVLVPYSLSSLWKIHKRI